VHQITTTIARLYLGSGQWVALFSHHFFLPHSWAAFHPVWLALAHSAARASAILGITAENSSRALPEQCDAVPRRSQTTQDMGNRVT